MRRIRSSLGSLLLVLSTGIAGPVRAITITASTDATTLVSALLGNADTGIIVTNATLNAHTQLVDVSSVSSDTPPQRLTSAGTYTNSSGTYGIGPRVVLSTGGVEGITLDVGGTPFTLIAGYSDGPDTSDSNSWAFGGSLLGAPPDPNDPRSGPPGIPASAAQEALLDPITNNPDCAPSPDFCDHFDVTELLITFDMQPGVDLVRFSIVFGSEEWEEYRDSSFIDGFGMFLNRRSAASP
jgi:hypothetical protein